MNPKLFMAPPPLPQSVPPVSVSEQANKVYAELDAAKAELDGLNIVNRFSLDTPQRRLDWDVAFRKATKRLANAEQARDLLVNRLADRA